MPAPTRPSPSAVAAAMRRIQRTMRSRTGRLLMARDDAFVRDLPGLVADIEAGFRRQECLYDGGGPDLRRRLADDAAILCALHRAMPQVERGDVVLGRCIVAALHDLLTRHGARAFRRPPGSLQAPAHPRVRMLRRRVLASRRRPRRFF